jgi:YVTN family beta-propeller protein
MQFRLLVIFALLAGSCRRKLLSKALLRKITRRLQAFSPRLVVDFLSMRKAVLLSALLFGVVLATVSFTLHALGEPGFHSGGSPVAASGGTNPSLLVVNQGDHNLSIVDPATDQQVATVSEDVSKVHGHETIASPDGRTAYVPIYGSVGVGKAGINGQNLLVIDLPTRKIVANIDFGHGVRPHCPIYDARRGVLYVTTELDQTVSIIDPKTLKIIGTIPTGQKESHMLVISHDGRRGYTANVGAGTVSVLDLANRRLVTVIPISAETQRISISNDDRMVFTSDQTKPQLAVIDTSTNKIKAWVPLETPGYGTGATKDGRWLLVTMPQAKKIAVVDLRTLKVVRTIDVPPSPQEVLVNPNGKVAYVSCSKSGEVAVIDLSQWKVLGLISAGRGADGLAWAR